VLGKATDTRRDYVRGNLNVADSWWPFSVGQTARNRAIVL